MVATDKDTVFLTFEFDPKIANILSEIGGECPAVLNAYVAHVVLERTRKWRESVRYLETMGWTRDDVRAALGGLKSTLFLESVQPRELADELRWVGLFELEKRVGRREELARSLLCVVLELRAGNAMCDRAIALMCPRRLPWWRKAWCAVGGP